MNHQSNRKSKDVDLLHSFNSLSIKQDNNYINKDPLSKENSVKIPSYELLFLTTNESDQKLQYGEEVKFNMLSLLSSNNHEDLSKKLLSLLYSSESGSCIGKSGCLLLLVQLIYCSEIDVKIKSRAVEALYDIIHLQSDEKSRRREIKILKLLEQVREYSNELKFNSRQNTISIKDETEKHPTAALGALLKLSFDAEHRQTICSLGGLYAITELIQIHHQVHGTVGNDVACFTLRRYAGMILINLTFGDNKNKNLLCSFDKFMFALVDQMKNSNEDLQQVSASIIRNLSWRADEGSKQALRAAGTVRALVLAAMTIEKESTLKSILSALWNLSAHCFENKEEICCVPGALAFIVNLLMFESASKTLVVVENAGGILRNISSVIAVREDFRQILRDHNCFEILLKHLRSPSLTVVSNACGTLWNLSARCAEDQKKLLEMGAINMLRNLVQSKHKMISVGSSAALKNLLQASPNSTILTHLDSTAKILGFQSLPTLNVRKTRALKQEINTNLAEKCDDVECNNLMTDCKHYTINEEINKVLTTTGSNRNESTRFSKSDSASRSLNKIIKQENFQEECTKKTLHESFDKKQSSQGLENDIPRARIKTSRIPSAICKKGNRKKLSQKENEIFNEIKLKENLNASDLNLDHKVTEMMKRVSGVPNLESKTKVYSDRTDELEKFNISTAKFFDSEEKCDFLSLKEQTENDKIIFLTSPSTTDIKITPRHYILSPKITEIYGDIPQNFLNTTETTEIINNFKQCDNIKEKTDKTENKTLLNEFISKNTIPVKPFNNDVKLNITSEMNNFEEFKKFGHLQSDFKICSEAKNSKIFENEARKICQEISKYQDLEMECSFNSEVSLISNSSFLDTSDSKIFDFAFESTPLDESETNLNDKTCFLNKNYKFQNDNDFESLELLNINDIEDIELDNSIVSVASITSEVAENYLKNYTPVNDYTIYSHNFPITNDLTKKTNFNFTQHLDLFNKDSLSFCQDKLPQNWEKPVNVNFNDLTIKNLTTDEEKKISDNPFQMYSFQNLKFNHKSKEKLPIKLKEYLKKNAEETAGIMDSCETNKSNSVLLNPISSLNDMIHIGPAERKELLENAKLVASFLKKAVQNFDSDINTLSNSTEFYNTDNEIDTRTYIKDYSQVK